MPGSLLPRTLADELVTDLAGRAAAPVSVIAPFTGEQLYELPHATVDEVQDAARRAREAQRAWWAAGTAHRRTVLLKGHDLFLERRELLLDAEQSAQLLALIEAEHIALFYLRHAVDCGTTG